MPEREGKRPAGAGVSVKSMTGFARVKGARNALLWEWEARSVNGRGLDVRVRLPPGYEDLEQGVRERAGRALSRGSLNIALAVLKGTNGTALRLNEAALREVLAAVRRIQAEIGAPPPQAEGILALKGVLEPVEVQEDEAERTALRQAMLANLDEVLAALAVTRAQEGGKLALVLAGHLAEIERLVALASALPARQPEVVEARLRTQVAKLMAAADGFDPVRLHQEAVLLATRASVDEELVRLGGHVAAARTLLGESAPSGRRLDFLAQELHREANTLCAKSNDGELTRIGLALKAVIDQFREQVQNIE